MFLIKCAIWPCLSSSVLALATHVKPALLSPSCIDWDPGDLPVRLILVGDSTTAAAGSERCAGGWGGALLAHLDGEAGATGINLGVCRMTTKTYYTNGHWKKALDQVKKSVENYATVVFISFGINDEHAGMLMRDFAANLVSFQLEVSNLGALPIFVTPLSQTSCSASGIELCTPSYSASTRSMIDVGKDTQTCVLDLNTESRWLFDFVGYKKVVRYRRTLQDLIHLNRHGAEAIGQVMCELAVYEVPLLPLLCESVSVYK